ncbi:MAG: ANTAR domain-containing protein [Streptosporangiaceae bacterium]
MLLLDGLRGGNVGDGLNGGDDLNVGDGGDGLNGGGLPSAAGSGPASRPGGQSPDLAVHRVEIDQATGMLTVQLRVSAAEAFARLRAYAYARDRRLADVAGDIVARRLRLDRDPGRDAGP